MDKRNDFTSNKKNVWMVHIHMKRYLTLTVIRKMIMPLRDITLLDRTKIKK